MKKEGLEILFLQETKMTLGKMEQLKLKLGFECCLAVEYEGRSGGLILLWKNEVLS